MYIISINNEQEGWKKQFWCGENETLECDKSWLYFRNGSVSVAVLENLERGAFVSLFDALED